MAYHRTHIPTLEEIYRPIAGDLLGIDTEIAARASVAFSLLDDPSYSDNTTAGKHIRPALVLLCADMCGVPDRTRLIRMAASCELVHVAALIHDDVIDEAATRRGFESVNARWDNRAAVLTGDRVVAEAILMLHEYGNAEIVRAILLAICNMVDGEMKDVTAKGLHQRTEDEYYEIIDNKTASLMSTACSLPAIYVGTDTAVIENLERFGAGFGMAFQIIDDLLDLDGDERSLGKAPFRDIANGKITLPLIHLYSAIPAGSDDAAKLIALVEGDPKTEPSSNWLRSALETYGSRDYCTEKAGAYIDEAKACLTTFEDSPAKQSLLGLCDFVLDRDL